MMNVQFRQALAVAKDKKALDICVLEMKPVCSFTDYFLICSGTSSRHIQTVCDAIQESLKKAGSKPLPIEGYQHAEWILMDYVDFVVHIFSERSRSFYDLERLWRNAPRISLDEHSN